MAAGRPMPTQGLDDPDAESDDFTELISSAIAGVEHLRNLQYDKKKEPRGRKRGTTGSRPGPRPKSVKLKLYHLPDACGLPGFSSARNYE